MHNGTILITKEAKYNNWAKK